MSQQVHPPAAVEAPDFIAGLVGSPQPNTLALITTHMCTAACDQCCFACSPTAPGRMTAEEIRKYVRDAMIAFDGLRLVVFTGGECFLLGRDLAAAVAFCKANGLATRCVTNGYWATSARGVEHHLVPLLEAGLTELNLSTGDEHQRYVPWERVRRAAIAAASAGITVLISIESHRECRFGLDDAHRDPVLTEFMQQSPHASNLLIFASNWCNFDQHLASAREERQKRSTGCSEIFSSVVVDTSGRTLACCGLQAHRIPEFELSATATATAMKSGYAAQCGDFAKLWLWLDGPATMAQAVASAQGLPPMSTDEHRCLVCRHLFEDPELRDGLRKTYASRVPDVLFRLAVRERLLNGTGST